MMDGFEHLGLKENKFGNGAKNCTASWKFRTVETLMQGKEIQYSPIEVLSTTKNVPMPNLIEKKKSGVFVKYEFEQREISKLKGFLWKFRIIRILMQGRITRIF